MIAQIPFAGFYESVHDAELDQALEQMFSDSSGNPNQDLINRAYDLVDWQKAQIEYAEAYAENFCSEFKIDGKFESMTSPREYNFTTDRIFITIDEAEVKRIFGETDQHQLASMAKEMFTSYDGFASFYDPDWLTWGDIEEWDHNQVYCLLRAYAEQETNSSDGFGHWAELDLMEYERCNSGFDNMIYNDKLERLCKIADYLRQREDRQWRTAA